MIKVKQQKIDEKMFAKMRQEQLAQWPTGKEVDIDEAVAYHKTLPDSKNFTKALAKYKAEGKIGLFPRSGVPVVEEEIKLLKGLNAVGVRLFPFTTDSYTRNLQLDKAQKGLDESIRTGKNKLNGYPIINHGVKTNRRVVESCEGALDPRSSRIANSFVRPRLPARIQREEVDPGPGGRSQSEGQNLTISSPSGCWPSPTW